MVISLGSPTSRLVPVPVAPSDRRRACRVPERDYVVAEVGLRHRSADFSVPQMWQLCEAAGLHPATLLLDSKCAERAQREGVESCRIVHAFSEGCLIT
jgi:hypothetical protein